MKKSLGSLITGALLFGAGLIVASTAIRNMDKETERIKNKIKKDKEELDKYSIKFE